MVGLSLLHKCSQFIVCFIITVISFLAVTSSIANAQRSYTVTLTERFSSYPLNARSYIVEDPAGKLTIQDLTAFYNAGDLNFRNTNPNGILLNHNANPLWIVFTVDNTTPSTNWLLDIGSMADGRAGIAGKFLVYEMNQRQIFYDGFQNGIKTETGLKESRYIPVSVPANSQAVFMIYILPTDYKRLHLNMSFKSNVATVDETPITVYMEYIPALIVGSLMVLIVGFINSKSIGYLPLALFYFSLLIWYTTVERGFYNSFMGIGFLSSFYPVYNAFLIALAALITIPPKYGSSFLRMTLMAFLGFNVTITILMYYLFPFNVQLQSYLTNGFSFFTILVAVLYLVRNDTYYLKPAALCLAGWSIFYITGQTIKIAYFSQLVPVNFYTAHADYLVLAPQAVMIIWSVAATISSEQKRQVNSFIRQAQKAQSLLKARKSKEENDNSRLLRVIEREREVMEELRSREAERTEEMRKAKITADEANQAKSAFLAVVSHEIRTPMTGIMGMIRILQDSDLSEEQTEYLMTIKDSGDAMLALLNDILDFSKIEEGGMTLENIEFDLHRVLNGVQMLMKGHADQKGIGLRLNIHENVPSNLYGDPTRLRQVILNLVGNALKFTTKGHVGINVFLETNHEINKSSQDKRVAIYFAVEDTGVGISTEAQDNLFRPFSQADSSISRKYGGTGLGLSICKRLVEAMGGQINLKSREGAGSTFFFTLPFETDNRIAIAPEELMQSRDSMASNNSAGRVQEPETRDAIPLNNQPVTSQTPARAQKLRFLIVDDNEVNRKVVKAFIEKAGQECTLIHSGKEALNLLKTDKRYNAIFLDIEMPDMNGRDVARAILKDSTIAQIPIVALTGNIGETDLKTYLQIGFMGYVAKPIIPEDMMDTVNAILSNPDTPQFPANIMNAPHSNISINTPIQKQVTTEQPSDNFEITDKPEMNTPTEVETKQNTETKEKTKPTPVIGKTLDEKMIKGLRDGLGAKQTMDLLDDLFEKADEIISNLREAIAQDSLESVSARAHELKGMAGNFGLKAVSEKASQLEKYSKDGSITIMDVDTHIEDLLTLIERSKLALSDYFD